MKLDKKATAAVLKQLPVLPRDVPLLQLFDQKTWGDAYEDYRLMLGQSYSADKAYALQAKLKTALRRYTLPGFGWVSTQPGQDWVHFLQSLSLQDLARALTVQETVFTTLGETVSDESRRTYRSALRQFVEHVERQPYYYVALGSQEQQCAPRMHTHKKRQEHWHRLKLAAMPVRVADELARFTQYLLEYRAQTPYGDVLVASTVQRFRREILDVLSWLHRFQGVPLATLSLECLVPPAALTDPAVAAQMTALLQSYLEWLEHELGLTPGGRNFALRSFIYLAEFWEYAELHRE